jgi:thiamine kinase-like enzyme
MRKLKSFHDLKLRAEHSFDIFERIEFYESLWPEPASVFRDYQSTKANVMGLKDYIASLEKEWVLTHIDAVPDNFLFVNNNNEGKEQIKLIDWEYAGMQDPHVDIAMFAIYSMYDREHIEALIDCYFAGACPIATRAKIYAYIAMCGLLWSNWCEYKRQLGVEFGEYALYQYRYAKDYYRIFRIFMEEKENE